MADFLTNLLGFLIIGLGLGSLWLNGLAIHRWSKGEHLIPRRFFCERHYLPLLPTVLTLAWLGLMVFLMFQAGEIPEFNADQMIEVVQSTIGEGLFVSAILLSTIALGVRHRYQLAFLGLRGDDLTGQIRDGATGFVMAFLPVSLVLLLCTSLRSKETLHPFLRLMQEEGLSESMAWVAVSAIIIAPLKEELMFRVILQTWLCNYLGGTKAIILGAIIFAGVHGFPDAIGLLPLALILGYVYHQTRSYLAVFTLHALFNAYNVFAMLTHVMGEAAI